MLVDGPAVVPSSSSVGSCCGAIGIHTRLCSALVDGPTEAPLSCARDCSGGIVTFTLSDGSRANSTSRSVGGWPNGNLATM